MGILPIDVVTMAPKSMEVSNVQHAEQIKQEMHDARAENAFSQTVMQNQEKTVHAAKAENEEYRYDAKDRRQKGNQKKKKEQEKKKKVNTQEEYQSGKAVFDIKI